MTAPVAWALVAGCAVLTFAIKAIGPVALGGRTLPARFDAVIAMTAPALLAALIVTQTLAHGHHLGVDGKTIGVALSGVVMWRTRSVMLAIVCAAAVTALLRAV